jgi:excisionase family DNA binding protein
MGYDMSQRQHHFSGYERAIAKKSCSILEKTRTSKITGSIILNINNQEVELPVSIVSPLIDILHEISQDHEPVLQVSPGDEWLSSQQAADILNVSRPFIVKLIDAKKIPCFKVGKHRRIFKSDLLSYKEKSLKERRKILQKLVDEAQELDMGY